MTTLATRLGRYAEARDSLVDSLDRAMDLVEIHNEKVVKNRQPRSALNAVCVASTVGAWERFVADMCAARTLPRWSGPGSMDSRTSDGFAALMRQKWRTDFGRDPYREWRVRVAYGHRGSQPSPLELLEGNAKGVRRLSVSQILDQWMELRNGVVHHAVGQRLRAAEAAVWRPRGPRGPANRRRVRRDPYRTGPPGGPRHPLVIWKAPTGDGTSIHSGTMRACLAFFVQLVDCASITAAKAEGLSAAQASALRMPDDWFTSRYTIFNYWPHHVEDDG